MLRMEENGCLLCCGEPGDTRCSSPMTATTRSRCVQYCILVLLVWYLCSRAPPCTFEACCGMPLAVVLALAAALRAPSPDDFLATHTHMSCAQLADCACNRSTLLQMIFAVFMDRGDSLLLEEYAYPVVTGKLS